MITVRLLGVRYHVIRTETRFPFHYGIAAMTAVPHLFLRGDFEIGGTRVEGVSAEGLPPKWFTKNPATSFDEDLPEMLDVLGSAVRQAVEAGTGASFFHWWRTLYEAQTEWAQGHEVPPLLAHLGTSLVERASIDAFCRAAGRSFAELVRTNAFGLRPSEIHPELAGVAPDDAVRSGLGGGWRGLDRVEPENQEGVPVDSTLFVRHTVGLADPLTDADIAASDRVDDGLPQSLEACIEAGGLRYFKIKLRGDLETDGERLRQLAALLGRACPGARFTLDGNEQYGTFADFRAHWETHRDDPALRSFLSPPGLLFVEQPLRRAEALAAHVADDLAAWPEAPPLIIDESDAGLDSARRALELGYAGTSHKNCKGVVKSIATAALMAHRAAEGGGGFLLSGEDLVNTGPVALLQDLAVMGALGIRHVERNGHHYFRGLSAFGKAINASAIARHGDLFRHHSGGFATLDIREGRLRTDSVMAAPFGSDFRVAEALDPWLTLEEWRDNGGFAGF